MLVIILLTIPSCQTSNECIAQPLEGPPSSRALQAPGHSRWAGYTSPFLCDDTRASELAPLHCFTKSFLPVKKSFLIRVFFNASSRGHLTPSHLVVRAMNQLRQAGRRFSHHRCRWLGWLGEGVDRSFRGKHLKIFIGFQCPNNIQTIFIGVHDKCIACLRMFEIWSLLRIHWVSNILKIMFETFIGSVQKI